jgi:pimeloyl-ACP methyl ester carboxylesterase
VSTARHIRTADGVQLELQQLGDPAGTPVILLHGTFSNHTFWVGTRGTGLARALAAHGCHAVVPDLRGHGGSDRPLPADRWSFHDWAHRDVPAVIDAVAGRHGCFLVGHSGGGVAALLAAAADPAVGRRVRGIVMLATPLPWGQRWYGTGPLIALASRLLGRFPARRLRLGPEDELAPAMIQWLRWHRRRRWADPDGRDYDGLLRSLAVPVLLLAGAGDRQRAPAATVRALHERIGSPDRTLLVCGRDTGFSTDFDHVGLVVSRAAREEVWPRVIGWIGERAEGVRA